MNEHDTHDARSHTPDDAALGALLRTHASQPPYDDVDWNALHARITTRARPLIRRTPGTWWQLVAGWSRRGIPVAALAAAALALMLGTGVYLPRATTAPAATVAYVTLEDALAAELSPNAQRLLDDANDEADVLDALLLDGEW